MLELLLVPSLLVPILLPVPTPRGTASGFVWFIKLVGVVGEERTGSKLGGGVEGCMDRNRREREERGGGEMGPETANTVALPFKKARSFRLLALIEVLGSSSSSHSPGNAAAPHA